MIGCLCNSYLTYKVLHKLPLARNGTNMIILNMLTGKPCGKQRLVVNPLRRVSGCKHRTLSVRDFIWKSSTSYPNQMFALAARLARSSSLKATMEIIIDLVCTKPVAAKTV